MMECIASVVRIGSLMMRLRERLFPAALALQFFFSMLQLLDAFHVWYFPLKNRLVHYLTFDLGFSLVPVLLLSGFVILGIFLLRSDFLGVFLISVVTLFMHLFFGFEVAVGIFSFLQVMWALYRFIDLGDFVLCLLVLLTGFESIVLIHWVLYPFGLVSPFGWFAELEMDLFYIAGNLAPLIVVFIFIISLVDFLRLLPGFNGFFSRLQIRGLFREIISHIFDERLFPIREVVDGRESDSFKIYLFLFFVIVIGIFAAVYPYSKAINPESLDVGVDISHYVYDAEIVEKNVFSAFEAWNRTRPMIFFMIYGFQKLFNLDVVTAVRLLPIILNPLLGLTTFIFASEVFNNKRLGVWAAFFTVCGFQVTVGMFSYFLANMLGLCFFYASMGFLFRSIRKENDLFLIFASLFGSLLVFTHTWTLLQFLGVFFIALLLTYYQFGEKKIFRIMLIYFISLSLAEVLKIFVFHGYGVVSASSTALSGVSVFPNFWYNNISVFRPLYGGIMSNLLILILTMGGILLLNKSNVSELYLKTLITISFIVFLFSDPTNMSRILYNIPFGLFSSLGYVLFSSYIQKKEMKNAFSLLVMFTMVVYVFRSMANFV